MMSSMEALWKMLKKRVRITGMDGRSTDLRKINGTMASVVPGAILGALKLVR